jgi:hypothetical protein
MVELMTLIEHLPLAFTILMLLIWFLGVLNTLNKPLTFVAPGYIEKFFLEVKLSQAPKKLFYPILESMTLYSTSVGIFLLLPFILYAKGRIDGIYIKYALLGKIPQGFVFAYLLVLIPASIAIYYGFRLFIALILDLLDIRDKHVEIKRSIYGFLVSLSLATVIGIILIII